MNFLATWPNLDIYYRQNDIIRQLNTRSSFVRYIAFRYIDFDRQTDNIHVFGAERRVYVLGIR